MELRELAKQINIKKKSNPTFDTEELDFLNMLEPLSELRNTLSDSFILDLPISSITVLALISMEGHDIHVVLQRMLTSLPVHAALADIADQEKLIKRENSFH